MIIITKKQCNTLTRLLTINLRKLKEFLLIWSMMHLKSTDQLSKDKYQEWENLNQSNSVKSDSTFNLLKNKLMSILENWEVIFIFIQVTTIEKQLQRWFWGISKEKWEPLTKEFTNQRLNTSKTSNFLKLISQFLSQ